ncbi:hypothetical protein [Lutispora sp.]|uniref:hypothetical protein n=1 Tax=Lutispora sp. TaxID=2828727 RepID=UPI003561676F
MRKILFTILIILLILSGCTNNNQSINNQKDLTSYNNKKNIETNGNKKEKSIKEDWLIVDIVEYIDV